MKYVQPLNDVEEVTLLELMSHYSSARARIRAHAVLLSYRRFSLNEIARIYQVDRDTVSHWLNRWETQGLIGLYDEPRSGRPHKLTAQQINEVTDWLQAEPRSIKRIATQILDQFHQVVSLSTLRRVFRQAGFSWKRIRKSLKSKRNAQAFVQSQAEIEWLRMEEQHGLLEVYFFDESGFSLEPVVPYAWQPKGQTLSLLAAKSQRLHVLGFLSTTQTFESFVVTGKVDTEVVIACFDSFSEQLSKPTWVILDNAAQHTAKAFKAKQALWQKRRLFVYYLPPYSPELNLIEIVWRFIKYAWLPFSAYTNLASLKQGLEEVLVNIGTKYQITFG